LNAFNPRAKNFYTPIIKKELAFNGEENILKRTLDGRYSSLITNTEWDKDKFYEKTVNFTRPPSPKGALSKFLRSTVDDVVKRQKEE
jgi:hypothetical protein